MNTYDNATVRTASAFFVERGYSVSATPCEYDNFDLICSGDKSGKFAVEVKGRNCTVNQYPDMRVDYLKYDAAVSAIKAGEYSGVLVCSIYNDGYLALGNILAGSESYADGPRTTCFNDTSRCQKHYIDIPRQKVWKID